MLNQAKIVSMYSEKYGMHFNPDLFIKDEHEVVEYLKKIILSCQRNRVFVIKVIGFKVIDSIQEIKKAIIEYDREKFERKNRNSKVHKVFDESRYDVIDLKESEIILLCVRYYVSINYESEYFTVIIKIPKVVDKYYLKLYGKYYVAFNQIVDASTYNNSNSKNNAKSRRKQNVVFRTTFMKTLIYRGYHNMSTTSKEPVTLTYYTSNIFRKSVLTFKYIFAKFGFFEGLDFMNMRECIRITNYDPKDPEWYTFCRASHNVYISSPRALMDGNDIVQSLVYTVYKTLAKNKDIKEYHLRRFWLKSVGNDFGNETIEKGLGILDSLEHIYDIIIEEGLHLPAERKKDIYDILKWMMGNYNELRQKNNLDISTKRIRWALHIACHYSAKIANGIYRIADTDSKSADSTIEAIRKAIDTDPDILLKELSRGNRLVPSKNTINFDDAIMALKFSYKGLSGIGEVSKSAIPDMYRAVNMSHIGRVDVTNSGNSDPGMSGIICPTATIYGDSFSDYEEPNSWEDKFNELVETYRKTKGLKEAYEIKSKVLAEKPDVRKLQLYEDSIKAVKAMFIPFYIVTEEEQGYEIVK